MRVGGHDCARGGGPAFAACLGERLGNARLEGIEGKMLPDDAGRRDEHLLIGAAHSVGGDARHLAGMFESGDARRGVRDAGVHHHGARGAIARGTRTAIGEMLP